MTFETEEIGVETGEPIELYAFVSGSDTFFYTSNAIDVTPLVQTYTATVIQRTSTAEGVAKREHDFEIILPTSDDVSQLFIGTMPGNRVTLTVSRYHRQDVSVEIVQIFEGFIMGAQFRKQGKECLLTARSTISSIGRNIPRRTCQAACNHVLYDSLTCQVDDTDPEFRASSIDVISQVGNIMTVDSLPASFIDTWADGGFVEAVGQTDFRLIISQTGTALTLHTPFRTTPTTVNVFAGCDHDIGGTNGCGPKFSNVDRFGGFAFVPVINPFESGI